MTLQSDLDFAGSVLPVLAAIIPGLRKNTKLVSVTEDGIKVEQEVYAWFESKQGTQTQKNLTKLFTDLGVKVTFKPSGTVLVSTPESDNPYSPGYIMGQGD